MILKISFKFDGDRTREKPLENMVFERNRKERTMKKRHIRRSNLIIRVAFILIFIFLFVSVINLQVQMRDLRSERDARASAVQALQDSIDELELRIATPIDDDYIERIARDRLGYRKPGEIIYYNDIAN